MYLSVRKGKGGSFSSSASRHDGDGETERLQPDLLAVRRRRRRSGFSGARGDAGRVESHQGRQEKTCEASELRLFFPERERKKESLRSDEFSSAASTVPEIFNLEEHQVRCGC